MEYEERDYDGFNRLTGITKNGDKAEYSYRANGLRYTKTVNGITTGYVWSGGQIAAETNGEFKVTETYAYGNERIKTGLGEYYVYNAHGDVTGLTDA